MLQTIPQPNVALPHTNQGSSRMGLTRKNIKSSAYGELSPSAKSKLRTLLNTPQLIKSKDGKFDFKVTLSNLLYELRSAFNKAGIKIKVNGTRLVGSSASELVSGKDFHRSNDLDIILLVDKFLDFNLIFRSFSCVLQKFLKKKGLRVPFDYICQIFLREYIEVYNSEEEWSLFTIGSDWNMFDIKVVIRSHRQYAFSVDSFQIILDDLGGAVQVWSCYGNFREAFDDLKSRRIRTLKPEDIRRGAFRYCLELGKGRQAMGLDTIIYDTVFYNNFYEEFADKGVDFFCNTLYKFLQRHRKESFSILANLKILLSKGEHPKRWEFIGAIRLLKN